MHAEPRALLKQAVQQCLPVLQPLVGKCVRPRQVFWKTGEGQWGGGVQPQTEVILVLLEAGQEIRKAAGPFVESFFARHPEYKGLVGSPQFGWIDLRQDPTRVLLQSVLEQLWHRHETFDINEAAVDRMVADFEAFVDKRSVRLLFRVQLLNFTAPGQSIDLPEGLRIRRMSDKEVSAFQVLTIQPLRTAVSHRFGLFEFCIEGELEGNVQFSEDRQPVKSSIKATLDKAILSLRTFKEGQVGYDRLDLFPITFCPMPLGSRPWGDFHAPFGDYALTMEEFRRLAEHAKLIFSVAEPSMEMACSRLADSETRTQARDRLIDAVIGMEALLLAGLGKDDRRGELKFRFSLHYSTLFCTPEERHLKFRVAKHLYDLRSTVAHGSKLSEELLAVGDEKLTLSEAAKRASEVLRHLVHHFLPSVNHAPYKKHLFWERAIFGLPDAELKPSN